MSTILILAVTRGGGRDVYTVGDAVTVFIFLMAGLLAFFVVVSLVRWWSHRMMRPIGAAQELDLEELRRQRDAGEIAPEEFDAIRRRLAGASPRPGGDDSFRRQGR